jgi:Fe-S-cluster containining protein
MEVLLAGQKMTVLELTDDGACVYLGPDGCTIHDRAPIICRTFDCRRFVQMNFRNRADRRAAASQSDVVRAGMERMKTL